MARRTLLLLAGVTLLSATPMSLAANDEKTTLAGLIGVRVVVEEPDNEPEGLSQSILRSDVESRLKSAGIRILTESEWQAAPGRPSLKLDVTVKAATKGTRLFLVELEIEQDVRLVRDASHSGPATTWSATPRLGVVPAAGVAPVVQAVREAVDEFIAAWRGASRRR